jgi:hypothetical protein
MQDRQSSTRAASSAAAHDTATTKGASTRAARSAPRSATRAARQSLRSRRPTDGSPRTDSPSTNRSTPASDRARSRNHNGRAAAPRAARRRRCPRRRRADAAAARRSSASPLVQRQRGKADLERRPVEILRRERLPRARGGHVRDEWREPLRATGRSAVASCKRERNSLHRANCAGAIPALLGSAGNSRDCRSRRSIRLDEPRRASRRLFGAAQHAFQIGTRNHDERARIGGTQIGAQAGVIGLIRLAMGLKADSSRFHSVSRCTVSTSTDPRNAVRASSRGCGKRPQARAIAAPPARRRGCEFARHREREARSVSPRPLRSAADRISAELRQPGNPDASSEAKPQTDVSMPSRTVGQKRRRQRSFDPAAHRRPARRSMRLHEIIDRVIDRFADQRDAESQRDAVDRTEAERHRRDAGERTGRDRQQAQQNRCRRSDTPRAATCDDQGGTRDRQPHGGRLDLAARRTANTPGPAHARRKARRKPRTPARRARSNAPLDRGHRALLAVGIGARGARRGDQQRAPAVARAPDTVDVAGGACAAAGRRFAASRRSDRAQAAASRLAGGRGELIETLLIAARRPARRSAAGRPRAQHVAMLEQNSDRARRSCIRSIARCSNSGADRNASRSPSRIARAQRGVAALDRNRESPARPGRRAIDRPEAAAALSAAPAGTRTCRRCSARARRQNRERREQQPERDGVAAASRHGGAAGAASSASDRRPFAGSRCAADSRARRRSESRQPISRAPRPGRRAPATSARRLPANSTPEHVLESGPIARQASRECSRRTARSAGNRADPARAAPSAFDDDLIAVDDQRLDARFDRAFLEPVRARRRSIRRAIPAAA